jgi:hypothetical protein
MSKTVGWTLSAVGGRWFGKAFKRLEIARREFCDARLAPNETNFKSFFAAIRRVVAAATGAV